MTTILNRHMLDRDDLLMARAQPLQRQQPLLESCHHSGGGVGEACRLHVGLLPVSSNGAAHLINAGLELA